MGNFYGIYGLKLINHGEWNDPEIEYRGYRVNYYAIENTLWEVYNEVQTCMGEPITDEGFEKWVPTQIDEVMTLVEMEIENKERKSMEVDIACMRELIDKIDKLIHTPDRLDAMEIDDAVHDLDEIASHMGMETFNLCMTLYEDDDY